MTKYEEGLSGQDYENRLDSKIAEVGSLIPKEDENSKYQLVIVEGHIFEIDRSVPKIVDYKGPANGVIVTAKITQNGDWQNPVATVTGTITKYGGGSVVSSTATATNNVTIPSDFPTIGGSYTIPNITTDTVITITTTDSEGKTKTHTIPVNLVRDNTPPVISNAKAEVTLMKIKISAKATDTESGLASLTYSVSPATIKTAEDGSSRVTGRLNPNGEPIEIEATAVGNYTVTITAEDEAGNPATVTLDPIRASDAMSIADAKRLVNSMSALKEYIGTKVDYKDGETWQIFYFDEEEKNEDGTGKGVGYFGPKNTIYLKRAYGEIAKTALTLSSKTENTDPAVAMMRRMNPKWANSSYSAVDLNNEKACVWLCDGTVWNKYKNDTYSSYAIGSPSVEMYMKAFNVYKTGNKDSNDTQSKNLICKVESENGYSVGARGTYTKPGYSTQSYTVEAGPGDIFVTPGAYYRWLASPSGSGNDQVLFVTGTSSYLSSAPDYNKAIDFCPVVPLDL